MKSLHLARFGCSTPTSVLESLIRLSSRADILNDHFRDPIGASGPGRTHSFTCISLPHYLPFDHSLDDVSSGTDWLDSRSVCHCCQDLASRGTSLRPYFALLGQSSPPSHIPFAPSQLPGFCGSTTSITTFISLTDSTPLETWRLLFP